MALINDIMAVVGIVFGVLILTYPALLAYLVGAFLIIYGIIKIVTRYKQS